MRKFLMKLQRVGQQLLALFVLTMLSGCATQPVEVPVAVDCPRPPQIHPDMLKPVPTQYLLPKELQRIAPRQP